MLRPYLRLAEKLGGLAAQLARAMPTEVTVYPSGETAEREVKPLTTAVLRGLLGKVLESSQDAVNYVNAPSLARDRGVRVIQSKTPHAGAYRNALGVKVETASGTTRVAGAVFDADTIRITQINDSSAESASRLPHQPWGGSGSCSIDGVD